MSLKAKTANLPFKAFLAFPLLAVILSCASAPEMSDEEKAAREAKMRDYCYANGGTWNDAYKTCIGRDNKY